MEIISSTQKLKMLFLDIWQGISKEDTKSLITLNNCEDISKKISKYCTKDFPIEKVLLAFHSYASIAYLSAELCVNAKIFLDVKKNNFILASYVQGHEPDAFCLVYSNIKALSQHPTKPMLVKDLISFVESDDVIEKLLSFYLRK